MVKAKLKPKGKSKSKEALPQRVVKASKDMAMARYDKHYHASNPHHKKHIFADIFLLALVGVLAVFSLWLLVFYQASVLREQIQLQVFPSSYSVRSGDALSYAIKVQNNTGQSLQETFLVIPQGTGFQLSSSTPAFQEGGIISLGTIDNKESLEVNVSGVALLDITAHLRVGATLHYKTGFTGVQQKLVSESININGSAIILDWDLPETIIANQPFPFEITYKNLSESARFDNVVVIPNFPPALEILETNRTFNNELGAWEVGTVGSLEQGSIQGRASINTADLDTALFEASLFSAPFGKPFLQDDVRHEIPVRFPNISVSFTSDQQTVSPGKTFSTTISVTNKEEFTIRDVKVRYKLNTALFSTRGLPGAVDAEGFYTKDLGVIITSGVTNNLDQQFTIRDIINPELAFGISDPRVIIDAELVYLNPQAQIVSLPIDGIVLGINTDLELRSFARYYSIEGDQIGRGPLPPVVGETTKYWVFLELDNQIHSVENLVIRASLPNGITWTGKSSVTSGNGITFNQGSNTIEWRVDSLPDYKTNFAQQRYGAAFEVAFTPTIEQVGKSIVLLREIEVQGKDSVTGLVVTDQAPLVTNNLLNDAFAVDTGEVGL